jgi:hypothetical protein
MQATVHCKDETLAGPPYRPTSTTTIPATEDRMAHHHDITPHDGAALPSGESAAGQENGAGEVRRAVTPTVEALATARHVQVAADLRAEAMYAAKPSGPDRVKIYGGRPLLTDVSLVRLVHMTLMALPFVLGVLVPVLLLALLHGLS